MTGAGRTIDVHAHLVPMDLVTENSVRIGAFHSRPVPAGISDLDGRVEAMQQRGVDMQVLSGWTELLAYDLPVDIAANFAKAHNASMARVARERASHLAGLATVPLQDPVRAAEVLEEAIGIGLSGVQIGTHVAGMNLDDPSLDPFWLAAERLGAFVLIHPAQRQAAGMDRLGRYYFENLLGNPFETAIAGASLIFGGVMERHPSLMVCLAHGGGFLPYQIGRLIHGYLARPECRERLYEGVRQSFSRLYFDSIVHDHDNLGHLIASVGVDRVLLGSDYPFDMGDDDPVATIKSLGLPQRELELVRGGNARRLLGL